MPSLQHAIPEHRRMRLEVLAYIQRYQQQHRRSPSQRHIARALKMPNHLRSHRVVHGLKKVGYLDIIPTEPGLAADLVITPAGIQELRTWQQEAGAT
jgi:SOS-response transcriptional repressor LexA